MEENPSCGNWWREARLAR